MKRILFFSFFLFFSSASLFAQIRQIPIVVEESFAAKYPEAEAVEFVDNLVNVQVRFSLNGEKLRATYTNKGQWKETEKEWSFEQLPADVKDGFAKSKYANWNVSEVKVIYRPGGEYYRIKAEKSDVQKRNLLFQPSGRLLSEDITL